MNHYVPQFDMEEGGYANAAIPSSGLSRQMNKQPDEIMELLWENGQVVVHSQNQQRQPRKSPPPNSSQHLPIMPPPHHSNGDTATHLFIQEDEMASWLHYPLDDSSLDRDLYTDLLYQHPPAAPTTSRGAEIRPNLPQPLPHQPDQAPSRSPTLPPPHPPMTVTTPPGANNFPLFSKMRVTNRFQQDPAGPSTSSKQNNNNHNHGRPNDVRERETTVVDSSDTPMVTAGISNRIPNHHMTATTRSSAVEVSGSGWSFDCRDTTNTGGGDGGIGDTTGGCPSVSRDGETCELTLTSSPGGSGASASATATTTTDRGNHQPVDDRKRKAREAAAADDGNGDYHSEDIEIESAELRKQSRGSTANKRSRAAEVHNLSERRRRDRINEKMKALQELIPRCSKTDKASMLDEAIEYLKSLQMQVQMMSMGCGMIPMMFSQQYMPSPMGMGMSMGMGLEMGMNRPMMPFPAMLSSSALQTPGAASHMGPRFQLPTFPLPPHHVPTAANMSRMQQVAVGQADHMTINHPLGLSSHHHQPNLPTAIPNMGDAYQQYMTMQQQMQVQNSQNQPPPQPSSTNPNKNRGGDG